MFRFSLWQWIQNEEPLEIGEPLAHAYINDEVEMGEVNIALDEWDATFWKWEWEKQIPSNKVQQITLLCIYNQ